MGKYRSPFNQQARISSGFWVNRGTHYHTGIDYVPVSQKSTTPLYAPASGTVQIVRYNAGGYGNYLVVKTHDGYVYLMGHMASKPSVKVGQKVTAGQRVGTMGSTGHSTGPHLHIEFQRRDSWIPYRNIPGGASAKRRQYVDPSSLLDMNKFTNSDCGEPSVVDNLVSEAKKHIDENGSWTWSVSGVPRGTAWCAAFIVACAKTVGHILNYVIYNSASVKSLVTQSVSKKYGIYHKGPWYGKTVSPEVGDLVTFGWAGSKDNDGFDHIELVTKVTKTRITTIGGNTGSGSNYTSKVKQRTWSRDYKSISGYYRPNWSNIDSTYVPESDSDNDSSSGKLSPLYDHLNDRNDMTLREIGYINGKNKPSINTSNIHLSVINYTTMLYNLFEVVADTGQPTTTNPEYDTSKLSSGPKTVINYFVNKGLNSAAAVGIAANISAESGFKCDLIETGYSEATGGIGLCQWTNSPRSNPKGRKTEMKKRVPNWKSNMSGQLDFLYYELSTKSAYRSVYSTLKSVPNTLQGAYTATKSFLWHFEIPNPEYAHEDKRLENAKRYWGKLTQILK